MNIKETSVTLKDIRFRSYHGVLPSEHIMGGDYLVTLTLLFPASRAMRSDRLEDTVNYADVYRVVKEEMEFSTKLIENVAYRILEELGNAFPILKGAECTVTKLHPPIPGLESAGISFTASVRY